MQRIVESWRVLPAGGLLCRVALCSLGKVMTHNQFDQSDVIMLTININNSGFAIDTGLWGPSLFCIVTDHISVSFISSNHSEDCGMGSSCFRPSQGCNPAKGVCWHLKRRWFHRFAFLACYEVVTHFIERYLFTTHNCGILWTHSHSPYMSILFRCMALHGYIHSIWPGLTHCSSWNHSLRQMSSSSSLNWCQALTCTASICNAVHAQNILAILRSLECCVSEVTSTPAGLLHVHIILLFIFTVFKHVNFYRCQKLWPSVPGSIFMLDNPSTVPKRVPGVWGVPASYFEGAFKLALLAYF